MIFDSNEISKESLNYDICVIGSGPASLSLISKYLNTKKNVIIIESGNFKYDKRIQELNDGLVTGFGNYPHHNYSLNAARIRKIGGTSNVWAGWSSPLTKSDFIKRDWIHNSGWPIQFKDLEKYYLEAQDILELSQFKYDNSVFNFYSKKLKKNILKDYDNFFWQFSNPPVNFGKKYIEHIKKSKNIHLYYNLTLLKLLIDKSEKNIEMGLSANHNNNKIKIFAKKYILGCGAIENASILLNSGKNNFNECFENVGKYFMEHPHCTIGHIKNIKNKNFLKTYKKNRIKNLNNKLFLPGVCLNHNIQANEMISNCINVFMNNNLLEIESAVISRYILSIKGLPISIIDLIKIYLKNYRKIINEILSTVSNILFKKDLYVIARLEQTPNINSRVYLSNKKNKFGGYLPYLSWKMNKIDKKTLLLNYENLKETFRLLGMGKLIKPKWLNKVNSDEWDPNEHNEIFGVGHHMGTTRMSNSSKDGVVDKNLKIHGIDNVYIIGSSVFPTSGFVNPTLSIVALSLRLFDHLENK